MDVNDEDYKRLLHFCQLFSLYFCRLHHRKLSYHSFYLANTYHTNICFIFFRYNNQVTIKREKIRQKQKIRQHSQKASTSKAMASSGDDESSSASSNELDIYDDAENTENLPPKEIFRSLLNHIIDRIPAMQEFLTYLVSMDGGCCPKEASVENVRRVGRLLYQVQTKPNNVELLWNHAAIDVGRRHF